MKILNIGSLNIDRVYSVKDFVKPSETIKAIDYKSFCGGKGLNQSIAVARAGEKVFHAGVLGSDGDMLLDELVFNGVDVSLLKRSETPSGHAIIEINQKGENRIIVCGGSNMEVTKEYLDCVFSHFQKGDILILQNEISNLCYSLEKAFEKGMVTILNPSPITKELLDAPIEKVSCLILNEIEGSVLCGEGNFEEILNKLTEKYKNTEILLTVGDNGAYYGLDNKIYNCVPPKTIAVDTVGAGDTFLGYYAACLAKNFEPAKRLKYAVAAGTLAITKKGASPSIPLFSEVSDFIKKNKM